MKESVYEVEPSRVPGVVNVVKPVLAPPVRKEKSRARSAPGAVKIFVSRNSPGGTKSKVTDVNLTPGAAVLYVILQPPNTPGVIELLSNIAVAEIVVACKPPPAPSRQAASQKFAHRSPPEP